MGHEVTIGGERLGSGKKMKTYLHNYERSTHDLGYLWRSTMASGTLVPFLTEVALPGDTFDYELHVDVLTHPTIGPLFGSYKVQLDIFQCPIRLFQGKLHMNMLNIGRDMSKVPLPQVQLTSPKIDREKPIDNQQINPSSIWAYLGIRGLGWNSHPTAKPSRNFNAVPFLSYWSIYKNYYANKQEEIGAVIHKNPTPEVIEITDVDLLGATGGDVDLPEDPAQPITYTSRQLNSNTRLLVTATAITADYDPENIRLYIKTYVNTEVLVLASSMFQDYAIDTDAGTLTFTNPIILSNPALNVYGFGGYNQIVVPNPDIDQEPQIVTFPLANIDTMRQNLLSHFEDTPFLISPESDPALTPYYLPMMVDDELTVWSQLFSQEGLAIKTYQSDLLNNWISTEWIDGEDGISAITAIDTSGGSFTIDELNLSKKIYDMLNRIAVSGGSYDDWLDAVYTHDRTRSAEEPMYMGGLITELVFQEVISNSATADQPLGTLAGRGKLTQKRKGGEVVIKVDEPSVIMGIVSLTPRIDYSQGNKWDTNLRTMNDLHKPALDAIGFQDLITDQMAWWDTQVTATFGAPVFKSAGKQPAWINYMTNINRVLGNFADQSQQMFMVLNRRYNVNYVGEQEATIQDVTTYIDPTKFNHIFADTRRDAQNFWVQIAVNNTVRRKMSAKVIPNL